MPREALLLLRQSINLKVLYCGKGLRYLSELYSFRPNIVIRVHTMHKTPRRCDTRGAKCARDPLQSQLEVHEHLSLFFDHEAR